jgi:hypothetical protein
MTGLLVAQVSLLRIAFPTPQMYFQRVFRKRVGAVIEASLTDTVFVCVFRLPSFWAGGGIISNVVRIDVQPDQLSYPANLTLTQSARPEDACFVVAVRGEINLGLTDPLALGALFPVVCPVRVQNP